MGEAWELLPGKTPPDVSVVVQGGRLRARRGPTSPLWRAGARRASRVLGEAGCPEHGSPAVDSVGNELPAAEDDFLGW